MAAAAAALCGCTTTDDAKCPLASALVDTASLTPLARGLPAYTVQVNKVDADCDISKTDHTVQSSLNIDFIAARSGAGGAAEYNVPYFVAVTLGNRIISKHLYTAHFSFDAGQTTAQFQESQDSPTIHMEKGKHPYDYAVLVGFQLTREQLEYNRTVGRYPK